MACDPIPQSGPPWLMHKAADADVADATPAGIAGEAKGIWNKLIAEEVGRISGHPSNLAPHRSNSPSVLVSRVLLLLHGTRGPSYNHHQC